ncbi:NEL-type E3 ubiquitin ligase domain-containing protein [Pseudomonas sp. NPDC089401]|uniref:NEL-type E3 ubiquitin ligase domain-containing protein n=1 Tax=Pseudomonas sp. NPDC089401 TaxID=3364462 RepID=UPI00380ED324
MPPDTGNHPQPNPPHPDNVIDDCIRGGLPAWLTRASSGQIAKLRERLNAHHATQARLRARTLGLLSPQHFAERQFTGLLQQPLPDGVAFEQLQWQQVGPSFSKLPDALLGGYTPVEARENGLLRLMHNFADVHYYLGTGLVAPAGDAVLSRPARDLVQACRALDVGAAYQAELDRVYDSSTCTLLASDRQSGLGLVVEVAALKGDISAQEQVALREMLEPGAIHTQDGLRAYPGLLEVLKCPVAEGLLIHLRNKDGELHSSLLYLPGARQQSLRRFTSDTQLGNALAQSLRQPQYLDDFTRLVALDQRAHFVSVLGKRLQDDVTDLELEGRTAQGSIFDAMARLQVQRFKDDARLLLVPTAQVDAQAAEARREAWKDAGLSLLNLAGFVFPAVGAVLLASLFVQTLGEVFEGVEDWSQGHRHEALEHLLGVAATVVATVGTVAAAGFVRSAFVDAMELVSTDAQTSRLWADDLQPYASTPGKPVLQADGRYRDGARYWIRLDGRYLEVHQPKAAGLYRLRHPQRPAAYGPALLHNGERGWQLLHGRPAALAEPAAMLDRLWPHEAPWDATSARQVLRAAGLDDDELRGVLVENRRVPINLRVILEQFEADAQIEGFFRQLRQSPPVISNRQWFDWCERQFDVGRGVANVLGARTRLRHPLFMHVTQAPASTDELARQLARTFTGLPDAYAQALATQARASGEAGDTHEASAPGPQRLPLALATQAHALARMARFNRMMAGCYLPGAYCDDTGILLFRLLETLRLDGLDVSLANALAGEEPLAAVVSASIDGPRYQLIHEQGVFNLYDERGTRIEGEPADDIYQALVGLLRKHGLLGALQITADDAAAQLRDRLLALLPDNQSAIEGLLGWPPTSRWWNPGQRLPDGRVGYLLSGRGPARLTRKGRLRETLRQLFPGLSEAQLEREVNDRWRRGGAIEAELRALEDDVQQLAAGLDTWVSLASNGPERNARQLLGERVLRAWRGLGDQYELTARGARVGLKLAFSELAITTLPDLPAPVTFQHVTTLIIQQTSIDTVHARFLQAFTSLQRLDMSGNRLLSCPEGLGYLVNLRRLRLAHNQIRLNAQSADALSRLALLTHLDLSDNPSLATYDINYLHLMQLTELRLRRCGLKAWPTNIELCNDLREVDLRDNALSHVPRGVLNMPREFRLVFTVTGNPLSRHEFTNLTAFEPIQEEPERATGRSWWVAEGATAAERGRIWDALEVDGDNAGVFELLSRLETHADISWQGRLLIERGWAVLAMMDNDPLFAGSVRRVVNAAMADDNDVIERFSQLLRLHAQARALNAEPALPGTMLLSLGRGLFRLDRLQAFVQTDISERAAGLDARVQAALGLRYRVRLRSALKLPFQPLRMHESPAPLVSAALAASAQQAVEMASLDEVIAQDLCRRPFWRRFLVRYAPASFADEAAVAGDPALAQRLTLEYMQRMARIDEGTERGVG